jgi:translation initiation factor 4A
MATFTQPTPTIAADAATSSPTSVPTPTPPEIVDYADFDDMNLPAAVLRGVFNYGFERPSPIQRKAIRPLIDGHDLIAQAQSGTGKTGAFSVGSLSRIDLTSKTNQVLVLSPTHELAEQTGKVYSSIADYMKGVDIQVHVGGSTTRVAMERLRSIPHVVIGTPGKIGDMFRRRGINGQTIKCVVIDEADEMLNRGFSEQVYAILQFLHKDVQVCLFSATLPPELNSITNKFMRNPVEILVKRELQTLEGITQYYIAVDNDQQKFGVLCDLWDSFTMAQTVVYCNKLETVEQVYGGLQEKGFPVTYVHGKMDPGEREKNFETFVSGACRVLISSDLTARGIDVQQVSTVVNFDFPENKETYLHRIGRSGRWGRKGMGLNLTTIRDVKYCREVEEFYCTQIRELTEEAVKQHGM